MFLTVSSAHTEPIQHSDVARTEETENSSQPLINSQGNHMYANEDVIQPTRNELIPSMYLTVPGNESHYEQIPCMDYLTPAPNVQNQDPNESTELMTDYLTPVSAEQNQNGTHGIKNATDYLTPVATSQKQNAEESIKPTTDCLSPIATTNNKHAKKALNCPLTTWT